VCVIAPPPPPPRGGAGERGRGGGGGGVGFSPPPPLYWRGMGLRRLDRHGARPPNEASTRLRPPSLRVHLESPRASTSRCGHRPCRASRHPAHLRTAPPCCVLPTCSGDADLEHRGHQGCGPRRRRVRRAMRPRVRRARRQQMPTGGRRAGGSFYLFIFCRPYSVSHPVFAPFVSAKAVTAAAAAAAGPAPSQRALSSQQGALRVAVAPAEARRVRSGPF